MLLALATAVKKPHDNISLGFKGEIAFFSNDFMLDTDKNEILAEDKIEVPMAGGADSSDFNPDSDSDSEILNDDDGADENCNSNDSCKKVEENSEEQTTVVEQIEPATRATNYPYYYGGYSGDGSSSNTSNSSGASDTSTAPAPAIETSISNTNDDDAGSPYGYYTDDNGGSIDDPLSK